jgi:hypothetical protein
MRLTQRLKVRLLRTIVSERPKQGRMAHRIRVLLHTSRTK